ncbi:MAG: SDR family NAD(P)-dependent oxidoreductase [Sulfuricurvum sp.]
MILANKSVLITGANGGLGGALVSEALKNGSTRVIATARDITSLEHLKSEKKVEIYALDITNKDQILSVAKEVGTLDLLINNAGVNSSARLFDKETMESFIDFEVNVKGTLNVCLAFKDNIKDAIVNVTSSLALVNLPLMASYSASKAALHSLTQALRAEMRLVGVEVYEALPGPIDTKMTAGSAMPKASPKSVAEAILKGYEQKEFEIFTDNFALQIKEALKHNTSPLEAEFASFLAR